MSARPAGSYTLVWTETFSRTARKFLRRHPKLAGVFEDVVRQLEADPSAPRLRMHALRGKRAVRVTYEYRIILEVRRSRKEVLLLDIGTHDEVYR